MPTLDLLLRRGAAQQFPPLWSAEILEETERSLVNKLGEPPQKARSRVEAMVTNFPDALVSDYEHLIPAMTNHPKDRHVLAAAVRSGAELIVTFNTKDFPVASSTLFDIDVRTPDDFLLDQLDLDPDAVVSAVKKTLATMQHPPVS